MLAHFIQVPPPPPSHTFLATAFPETFQIGHGKGDKPFPSEKIHRSVSTYFRQFDLYDAAPTVPTNSSPLSGVSPDPVLQELMDTPDARSSFCSPSPPSS